MTFIPGNMPQSGSQWQFGAPGLGSIDALESLTPAGLSFNQGSVASPLVNTNQLVQTPNVSMSPAAGASTAMGPMGIANAAIGGLQTLGNLYMAFQANKLAKKQFRFQRDFANANLANSIKSYNTALEDRIRSRSFTEGRPDGYADTVINKNRLEDRRVG